MRLRSLFLILFLLIGACIGGGNRAEGQIQKPVKLTYEAKKTAPNEYDIVFKAKIEKKWHVYSHYLDRDDGPVKTDMNFKSDPAYQLVGPIKENGKLHKEFDKNFDMELKFYEDEVTFIQHVKLLKNVDKITGEFVYMVCDDKQCLPPEYTEFSFDVKYEAGAATGATTGATTSNAISTTATTGTVTPTTPEDTAADTSPTTGGETTTAPDGTATPTDTGKGASVPSVPEKASEEEGAGLLSIFIQGFLGGFIALLTPCVFPMIPLTVSFFIKKASKATGIGKALLFGLSIIVIYVGLGFILTRVFGANALNNIASNAVMNLIFFVVFVVFGLSFLGAFDISLPTSWANKADAQSEKGGLIGIFFMAFTLAIVSFSCTGPIIGQLLVSAAYGGGYQGPIVGMFAFSLALAIPFTLFAIFPSWMQNLPRSGGWLNSVKVTLGFVELAAALKFLSAVDLAYHWNFLHREYFLVIWIMLFALLGFYLLGKIRFSHDTELPYVSIPRFMLAVLAFAFSLYMVPGLWGAPLNMLSGLAPPNNYTEGYWTANTPQVTAAATSSHTERGGKKNQDLFHCPHGLDCHFDYQEGLERARKEKKPLLLDFTGHSCVNCRKMENTVWSRPEVLKRLQEDVILVSLYVDDRTKLPESEQYTSKLSGEKIKYLGEKWADLENSRFNRSSQPYYVLLDGEEKELVPAASYDPDPQVFIDFLDKGKAEYKKRQK